MDTVACAVCGRIADPDTDGDPPLTWTMDVAPGTGGTGGPTTTWACDTCTRRHLRSIEAKLDQEWW